MLPDAGHWQFEFGLIDRFAAWHTAVSEPHRQAQPNNALQIAVNLSPKLFVYDDLVQRIAVVIEDSNLPPSRIELEITESVFVGNSERALRILHDLKHLGIALAMDDFGTGYSSLGYLLRFPLDIIKLDRSLVTGIEHEGEVAKVARGDLARHQPGQNSGCRRRRKPGAISLSQPRRLP